VLDLESQLDKNRDDVSRLTANVAALTEIVKAQGQRQDDAIISIKEAVTKIGGLDEKMTGILVLNQKFTELDKTVAALRHDVVNTIMPAQNTLPAISTDVTTLKTQMTDVMNWKTRVLGGVNVLEKGGDFIWKAAAIIGPVLGFVLSHYIHFGQITISGQ
jgi:hypothetical protein